MFNIRPMRADDISQVERIERDIFSMPWSAESFSGALNNKDNIYLVCEDDGVIAGYCGIWTVLGEGNLTNMAVKEDYRRQGIARLLLEAAHERSSQLGVTYFFLEVRESNEAARALYSHMGYVEAGKRKRFYERPVEDAVIMTMGQL